VSFVKRNEWKAGIIIKFLSWITSTQSALSPNVRDGLVGGFRLVDGPQPSKQAIAASTPIETVQILGSHTRPAAAITAFP
jgi:hypothetical protein